MPEDEGQSLVGVASATFIAVVIVASLYLGRDLFVPLSLALLLSFVLAPLVLLLQRFGSPRGLAVMLVVTVAFAALFALATLMGRQLTQLAADLPRYESTIRAKVKSLRGASAGDGTLERAADMLQSLGKELERPSSGAAPTAAAADGAARSIQVVVSPPTPGPLESLSSLISPLLHPLATTGLIVVFVIFILVQREDLRNKLIKLGGTHDIQRTTAALNDAALRLSRLFLAQLAINSAFGVIIGVGLWAIGVPSYALWGILAAILRFVPYIGAVISAAFPLTLAAAVDPGWSMLIMTGLLFLIVEPVVGHGVEPVLLGQSTGLSPVAVVLAAAFWTLLWGPIGLVLATPLTVCFVVLGRHIERLALIDVLLGDRPALEPWELLYQRLLAGDTSEAVEQAEEFLKDRSYADYYDGIVLNALGLAQADLSLGSLTPQRAERVRDAVSELVSDLQQNGEPPILPHEPSAASVAALEGEAAVGHRSDDMPVLSPSDLPGPWTTTCPVLCVAAKTAVDEAAAIVMADLLTKHGLGARATGVDMLTTSNLVNLDLSQTAMICLVSVGARHEAHLRNLVKRLRRKQHRLAFLIAVLSEDPHIAAALQTASKADWSAADFRKSCAACIAQARALTDQSATLAPASTKAG
ncbi:AI-2E family transporter [Alsobacter sp. SYSU BS001988]